MQVSRDQLRSFLADAGLVTGVDFDALEQQAQATGKSVEDVIVNTGKVPATEFAKLQAHILGIPFVDLEKEKIPYEVLSLVPEPIAKRENVIAYKRTGNDMEVAMLDPGDLVTLESLKKTTGLVIKPRLTTSASITKALEQYQKSLQAEFGDIIKKESDVVAGDSPLTVSKDVVEAVSGEDLKKLATDLPIIKIVDTLLRHAILQKASDIHIEPQDKEMVVRYRIDGLLHDAMTLPKQVAVGIIARIKVLSNLRLDEHRLPQDGRFAIETSGYKISFRVSILPVFDGEKAVMRLLPENTEGFSIEALGFHGDALERMHRAVKKTIGMILATGPTGSGKTTTLYTLLDVLNTPDVNISTIEDPIEYRMKRINQTQVRPDIGFTFANGLRSLVRQDPDILMVGEIRDAETAGLAINAALTGHLVLSTLHTNSAAGALPRLVDMGMEPFLIVSTVDTIIGQRLVRRIAEGAGEKYFLTKDEVASIGKELDLERVLEHLKTEGIVPKSTTVEKIPFYKTKPTQDAPDGFRGRLGIHEVLTVNETIRALVMQNATANTIEAQAKKEGMLSMIEDGIFKAAQGLTTIEEVLRVTLE